jgi:hypothetical protein
MTNNIKKRNKPSKEEHYKNEREDFLNELNNFLGLSDDNNTLLYTKIKQNKLLLEFINSNEDKIKKYFKYGKWGFYQNYDDNTKDLGTLIKNIYKHEKYTIYTKRITLKENDTKINATQLIFYKPGRIN